MLFSEHFLILISKALSLNTHLDWMSRIVEMFSFVSQICFLNYVLYVLNF